MAYHHNRDEVVPTEGEECAHGGQCFQPEPPAVMRAERIKKLQADIFFLTVLVLCVCAACYCLQDWLLGPYLIIAGVLVWHTRHDRYAALPGFVIGFVLGIITSAGIGLSAEIMSGLFIGTLSVPVNAICRGYWRVGIAAFMGITAYWIVIQLTILLVFSG